MTDKITPWSENRNDGPVELPPELAAKNTAELNPLAAPQFYAELYDRNAGKITVTDPETGSAQKYELVQNINNPDSSFHAKIVANPETGHHIIFMKGMDLPGRDEGAGELSGPWKDNNGRVASSYGCVSDQVLDAEKAYLELLQDPDVKSISVVGYSIGAIPANYLASVYDVKVTNIADLGVPGTGSSFVLGLRGSLTRTFDVCSNGLFPGAAGDFKNNLDENVTGLVLRADGFGGQIGAVGKEFGNQITLDEDGLNPLGAAHIPQVYADTIADRFSDAPDVEATATSQNSQFKPF